MTDLEMTKLCAEAMEFVPPQRSVAGLPWNPLVHDAQAMALVKKFKLRIGQPHPETEKWFVWARRSSRFRASSESLNRAIVECVAKIQAAKK